MERTRANSSLVAILIILLVIAGVIYLFWQNSVIEIPVDEEPAVVVEDQTDTTDETAPDEALDEEGTEGEEVAPDDPPDEEEPTEE